MSGQHEFLVPLCHMFIQQDLPTNELADYYLWLVEKACHKGLWSMNRQQ